MRAPQFSYAADVVLLVPADDPLLLVVTRSKEPYQGCYSLPGGHVDPGESAREAAVRELSEETGISLDVSSLRVVGTWDTPGRDPRGNYVAQAFLATLPAPLPVTAADDAASAAFLPLSSLTSFAFDHAEIIAEALRLLCLSS